MLITLNITASETAVLLRRVHCDAAADAMMLFADIWGYDARDGHSNWIACAACVTYNTTY